MVTTDRAFFCRTIFCEGCGRYDFFENAGEKKTQGDRTARTTIVRSSCVPYDRRALHLRFSCDCYVFGLMWRRYNSEEIWSNVSSTLILLKKRFAQAKVKKGNNSKYMGVGVMAPAHCTYTLDALFACEVSCQ